MIVEGESLGAWHPEFVGYSLSGVTHRRCEWERVEIRTRSWRRAERPNLADLNIESCRARNGWRLDGCVLDGVTIADARGHIFFTRCAMRHVRLVGALRVFEFVDHNEWSKVGPAIVDDNEDFHAEVDWMLDISELDHRDQRIMGLPPEKVIIDPERQAFISAESVEAGREWLSALPESTAFGDRIASSLNGYAHPRLLSVAMRGRNRAEGLAIVRELHDRGCTVPTFRRT